MRPHVKYLPAPLWVGPLLILLLAATPLPYGFYTFIRLVVCLASIAWAFSRLENDQTDLLGWSFVALALLYNPIFRVHLGRETWVPINLISALAFGLAGWTQRSVKHDPSEP